MKVLVLMSTYNGKFFLRYQLDSILSQEGVDVYLLIRDDGSEDGTRALVEEYALKHSNIECEVAENIGFVMSFSKLVEKAQTYHIAVDYYAFADQDDVWFPNKLKKACEALSKMNQNKPLLFSSNSTYADEKLKPLGNFHVKEPYRTRENVMIFPTEQGCSMVFNKKAIELYNMHPPIVSWHDRWMCLICNFMGEMMYCHEPLFFYRVHGNNTLGEKMSLGKRVRCIIEMLLKNNRKEMQMVEEFFHMFENYISLSDKVSIKVYLRYRSSLSGKVKLIISPKYQQSLSLWNRLRKSLLILFNRL